MLPLISIFNRSTILVNRYIDIMAFYRNCNGTGLISNHLQSITTGTTCFVCINIIHLSGCEPAKISGIGGIILSQKSCFVGSYKVIYEQHEIFLRLRIFQTQCIERHKQIFKLWVG